MKQSTKLLSLVLALVMAFSFMTVIGSAAATVTKAGMQYDSIDDAVLTPEQVSDIALDLVDGILADADFELDLVVATIDLRSVNRAFETLNSVGRGWLLALAATFVDLGVIEELDFTALGPSDNTPYQRSGNNGGNLLIVKQLLEFLADNATKISPVAYGIGGNGLDLGLIGSLVDLGDIETMLADIPGMIREMVYDLLVHGSYTDDEKYENQSYPSAEELKEKNEKLPFTDLDVMINNALLNLLINPQDYSWEDMDGDGEAETKDWDEEAILLPGVKAYQETYGDALTYLDIDTHSVFDILDVLAQFAIDDLGVPALNNNLKKELMEAVEVEFNEIDYELLPGSLDDEKTTDVVDIFANTSAYVTYIGYDCMAKDEATGDWYYTTLENQPVDKDGDKIQDTDPETKEPLTERVPVYYKANTAVANDFYNLINWDYKILRSDDPAANELNSINYAAIVTDENTGYGSITEALNHLIYIVYENAIQDDVKDDFQAVTGNGWVDGTTSENINDNIERLLKYLLSNFADRIFGSDSPYADKDIYGYDFYEPMTLIDIVALIGPGFFDGVMPQLIIPTDADGAYAFATSEDGVSVALLQFGALVLREFTSEIAPNVNYDEYIFDDVTSAEGRQFAEYDDPEAWFNIILNMGVDIGYTYLYQITNFGDTIVYDGSGLSVSSNSPRATTLPEAPTAETVITEERWMGMLDKAIDWAVDYVGQGSNGVLSGINPAEIDKMDGDPLGKLSYILNTILPLGFVNGCNSENYDLDVAVLFDKVKTLLTTFDLTALSSLFGRNGDDGDTLKRVNILAEPVVPMVLNLVNDILKLVFGADIFPATDTLENVIKQSSLQKVIENLLIRLNAVKEPLLTSALPVVGKLIKGWGTEQNFEKPDLNVPSVIWPENGVVDETISVKNAADGIWRSWIDADGNRQKDDQYQIKLVNVKLTDFSTGEAISGVSATDMTTALIPYGGSGSFKISASNLTKSTIVRIDLSYKVYEGETEMVKDTDYTMSAYTYLSAVETDQGKMVTVATDQLNFGSYTADYIDISRDDVQAQIESSAVVFFERTDDHDDNKIVGGATITGSSSDTIVVPGKAVLDGDLGTGSNRAWTPLFIFKNQEQACVGGAEGFLGIGATSGDKKFTTTGAVIDMDNFNKKPGDKTELTFVLDATKDDCGKTKVTGTAYATLVYYDGAVRDEITDEVTSEIRQGKVKGDYITTGYSYADRVLATETTVDEVTGEKTLKETNSKLTAWVDEDGVEINTQVTPVTPDAKNEEIGTYIGADGEEYSAKLVTKINNSNTTNAENGKNVWDTYVEAVKAAAAAGLDGLTVNTDFNYGTILEDLIAASNDLDYCKADAKADPTVSNAIVNLKAQLDKVEEDYTDDYDHTDYMMWRLNRLNDTRDDASYYINLKKDADRGIADVDAKFPYTSIEEDDLRALVSGNATLSAYTGGTGTGEHNFILALLEDLTDEERKEKEEWLKEKDKEYAEVTSFDIALASKLLEKTSTRLRDRDYKAEDGADTTYLATEITSAKNVIGIVNDDGSGNKIYTDRSWTKYATALEAAENVLNGTNGAVTSQMNAFDAKWELLCSRNELVLVENEADYSELETLIKQAENALANQSLYNNTAKELGQVLAELGLEGEVKDADGNKVNLFPGSAIYVNAEPYSIEDQDEIDDAATALKEALARLKFKGLTIAGDNVAVEENATIVFDDLDTEDEDETVTSRLATIAAGLNEAAVKELFEVTADDATVIPDNITVTSDLHYSVEKLDEEGNVVPFQGFTGTNAVVTFYTVQDGVKIPVATVKIIVKGDINGDGTVDVIDGAQMSLVSNDMAELDGCYFIAGNLSGDVDGGTRVINGDDYAQVINEMKKVS